MLSAQTQTLDQGAVTVDVNALEVIKHTTTVADHEQQTAARMIPPLGRWKRFDEARAAMMRAELERILAQPGLSRDTTEQASKSLLG